MKLELKHLAGYLPYGLKVKWNDVSYYKMISLRSNESCQLVDRFTDGVYGVKLTHVKPILHPLSDLTKEIEVNGEKFVPIERLEELFFDDLLISMSKITGLLEIEFVTNDYSHSIDFFVGHEIVKKLYEWHLDIHGLIEKGLAIDINTL